MEENTLQEQTYIALSQSNPQAVFEKDSSQGYFYNGKTTIEKKSELAIKEGCLGIMIWEISQDRNDQYSLLSVIHSTFNSLKCPKPALGKNKALCGGSTSIHAGVVHTNGMNYKWHKNGIPMPETTNNIIVNSKGTYLLTVTSGDSCTFSDEIEVFDDIPVFSFGVDTNLCKPASKLLDAGVEGSNLIFKWYINNQLIPFNSQRSDIMASSAGKYTLKISDVSNTCTSKADSINITSSLIKVNNNSSVTCLTNGNASISLSILDTGGPYEWYTQALGGTSIYTGNTYSTSIDTTSTFYIKEESAVESAVTARINKGSGWNRNVGSDIFQKFVVQKTLTIDTVSIYSEGTYTFSVKIFGDNKSTLVYQSTPKNCIVGKQLLKIGYTLSPGTYYLQLSGSTGSKAWFDQVATDVNYSINNVITVYDKAYAPTYLTSWYGHIFEWKISGQGGNNCDRTPVTVYVDPCLSTAKTAQSNQPQTYLYPNPVTEGNHIYFDTYIKGQLYNTSGIPIEVVDGMNHNTINLSKGMYFIKTDAGAIVKFCIQ